MNRAMPLSHERAEPGLLDEEVWDSPRRLTEADLHAQAGADRRRVVAALDDPEDER